MEFIRRVVPLNFNLFKLGDCHIGSLLFHERGFFKFIDQASKPYKGVSHNCIVGMGDYIEAITNDDKRFDIDTTDFHKIRPANQMDYFVEHMYPLRKKIITLLAGNHEYKLLRYYDYVKQACSELEVPYGTYTTIVSFVDKRGNTLFKAFFTHGRGSVNSIADSPERRKANMLLGVKRKLWNKSGDCALMAFGHTHKLLIAEPAAALYLTSDSERTYQNYTSVPQNAEFIPRDLRWYVNTGSLLRLYRRGVSGYAEQAMYDPMELGYTVTRVRGGKIVAIDKVTV